MVSEYKDYEIPTELLLAVEQQKRVFKSKSAHELRRAQSNIGSVYNSPKSGDISTDSNNHSPTEIVARRRKSRKSKRNSTRSGIFGTFSKKVSVTRSISDILGSPPPLPNRRPSMLCTCCNTHHVINQSLPGMSFTPRQTIESHDENYSKEKLEGLDSGFYDHLSLSEARSKDYEVLSEGKKDSIDLGYEVLTKKKNGIDYETLTLESGSET